MDAGRWFWLGMVVAAIGWYSAVTVYVAVRGAFDIRRMLARLREGTSSPRSPG